MAVATVPVEEAPTDSAESADHLVRDGCERCAGSGAAESVLAVTIREQLQTTPTQALSSR